MKGSRPPAASQAAVVRIEARMLAARLSASTANGPNEHFFALLLAPLKRTCLSSHGGEGNS